MTQIPAARRKMQEAQFFFSRLGSPLSDRNFPPEVVHRAYLGAFLAAAQSVVDVAIFEVQQGFLNEWLDTLAPDDREFFQIMREQRIEAIHRRGVEAEEQTTWPSDTPLGEGWLADLVPERMLVIGNRTYGAYFAAGRLLGLLSSFLGFADRAPGSPH
jgi:hypothetical protein